jgi:hypothetical protein
MALGMALVLVGTSAGCGHREVRGEAVVYQFEWYTFSLIVSGGLLLAFAGWALSDRGWGTGGMRFDRIGTILMALGLVGATALGSYTFLERILVDRDRVEIRTVLTPSKLNSTIHLKQLKSIVVRARTGGWGPEGFGSRRQVHVLEFEAGRGGNRTLTVSGLLEPAESVVLQRAREAGVRIIDRTVYEMTEEADAW